MVIWTQALSGFMTTIDHIRVRGELSERIVSIDNDALSKWVKDNRNSLRISDYATTIILLYGALEQYLESLVVEYLAALSETSSRNLLPKVVTESHFRQSIEYIKAVESDSRLISRNPRDRLSILKSIMEWESQSSSTILGEAFLPHRTFNIDQIRDYLKRIGIELEHIKSQAPVKHLHDQEIDRLPLTSIFQPINQLAESRNLVAHGNINDTHAPDILESWRNFVVCFCAAVDSLAIQTCYHFGLATKPPIPEPGITLLNIYLKSTEYPILCFTLPANHKLSTHDLILLYDGEHPIDIGLVISLQIGTQAFSTINQATPVDIGAQVVTNHSKPLKSYTIRLIEGPARFILST